MAPIIRTAWGIPAREITDEGLYLRRREFLAGAAALLFAGCGPGIEGAGGADFGPGHPLRTNEPPTDFEDATRYNNFYEFGTDKQDPARLAGSLRPKPWPVAIEGEVAKPGVLAPGRERANTASKNTASARQA